MLGELINVYEAPQILGQEGPEEFSPSKAVLLHHPIWRQRKAKNSISQE